MSGQLAGDAGASDISLLEMACMQALVSAHFMANDWWSARCPMQGFALAHLQDRSMYSQQLHGPSTAAECPYSCTAIPSFAASRRSFGGVFTADHIIWANFVYSVPSLTPALGLSSLIAAGSWLFER